MISRTYFIILLFCCCSPAYSQSDCYQRFIQEGRAAYEAERFEEAGLKFLAARECERITSRQYKEATRWKEESDRGFIRAIQEARAKADSLRKIAEVAKQEAREAQHLAEEKAYLATNALARLHARIDPTQAFQLAAAVHRDTDLISPGLLSTYYAGGVFRREGHFYYPPFYTKMITPADTGAPLCFSDDGQWAVLEHPEGCQLFNLSNEKASFLLVHPQGQVRAACFGKDNLLITGDQEGKLKFWDTNTGQLVRALTVHSSVVNDLFYLPGPDCLLSCSDDRKVVLMDGNGQVLHQLIIASDLPRPTEVTASYDLEKIAVRSKSDQVFLWHKKGKKYKWCKPIVFPSGRAPASIGYLPEEQGLLVTDREGLRIYRTEKPFQEILLKGQALFSQISALGDYLVVPDRSGAIVLYKIKNGEIDREPFTHLRGHQRPVSTVYPFDKGRFLYSYAPDLGLLKWNIEGKDIPIIQPEGVIPFTPAPALFSAGFSESRLNIQNKAGETLAELPLEHPFEKAAVSPDGRYVAAIRTDKWEVHLWAATGKILAVLPHPSKINDLNFSPDSRYLVTGTDQGIVDLWTITGQHTYRFQPMGDITRVYFSEGGDQLIMQQNYGKSYTFCYPVSAGSLVAKARELGVPRLSEQEMALFGLFPEVTDGQ